MNHQDDTSRFTIRGAQTEPDAVYMADADNLRIEKLSTRVTLVAVLIPCLLVVVLVIAYLDIKNRVSHRGKAAGKVHEVLERLGI